jgi:hypothetical protein
VTPCLRTFARALGGIPGEAHTLVYYTIGTGATVTGKIFGRGVRFRVNSDRSLTFREHSDTRSSVPELWSAPPNRRHSGPVAGVWNGSGQSSLPGYTASR